MYVCTYVRMYVCTYVRMYVCTYVRMYVSLITNIPPTLHTPELLNCNPQETLVNLLLPVERTFIREIFLPGVCLTSSVYSANLFVAKANVLENFCFHNFSVGIFDFERLFALDLSSGSI
jgi:hypothetical protein